MVVKKTLPITTMYDHRYHELKHVVIVGDGDYIEREWDTLATLPKVYFLYEYDCE